MQPIEYVKSALRRLELSDLEQTVYLSLLRGGEATARNLAARTGITRPSVYDQLKNLKTLGLVNTFKRENKKHFAAADAKHLSALLNDRIDRLEQSRDALTTALPSLADSLNAVDPKVRFFEGSEGVKQLLKDIMWHDNETLKIIWAQPAMAVVFAPTFLAWFDERRAARNLAIHSLWPHQTKKSDQVYFNQLADDQGRHLAKNADVSMSTIIYGNKVAHISSTAEAFGFIVDSAEYKTLQTMQFTALWNQSK